MYNRFQVIHALQIKKIFKGNPPRSMMSRFIGGKREEPVRITYFIITGK